MFTQRSLANELGITKKQIPRLIEVGLLPRPTKVGSSNAWTHDQVEPLLNAGKPNRMPPAILVKVGPAKPIVVEEPEPFRDHIGWTNGLDPMNPDQIAGIDRWWAVKNAETWINEAFIVSTNGFVLAVYAITNVTTLMGQRHFELDSPTEEMLVYKSSRFPAEPGPMTKSWR